MGGTNEPFWEYSFHRRLQIECRGVIIAIPDVPKIPFCF